jgi:hypothetical protein
MQIIFAILFVAMLSYAGWTIYTEYSASKETGFHRWIDAAEGSATILWSKFVMIVTALAGLLAEGADYFNAPGVGDAIKAVMKPEYVMAGMILISLVTVWARKRTL